MDLEKYKKLTQSTPWLIALLLGLGIPNSFTLLYVIYIVACLCAVQGSRYYKPSSLLIWSISWLLIFGVTHSIFQVGWGVWDPPDSYVREILAIVILPSFGLLFGRLLSLRGRLFCTTLILAYVSGALIYCIASLAISRSPWWNLTEVFHHVVRQPWGNPEFLSTRAVEQRAFLSFALLPIGLVLIAGQKTKQRFLGAAFTIMSVIAFHVSWALSGRLGLLTTLLSCAPLIWLMPRRITRKYFLLASLTVLVIAISFGLICDERIWLISGFITRLFQAPWGGRLIRFSYSDCDPSNTNYFGSYEGSSAFTAHNVILDIYNDSGWMPALSLLLGILPITIVTLNDFFKVFTHSGWDWHLALRWSFVSVLLIQWTLQPFLYTDQLMFSVGFVVIGMLRGEFESIHLCKEASS